MNEREKFLFDLNGFILLPEVLKPDQIKRQMDHAEAVRTRLQALPPEEQHVIGGVGQELIDHPVIMDVLHTIIGKTEKIRLESAFYNHREPGFARWSPHAGGRTLNPVYNYIFHDGRIYSGMTRVVFELTEVRKGQGGTCLIPGSHKANLPFPKEVDARNSEVWWTYGCPPGSILIFSEAVRHSSADWTADHPRCALFYCYNHACVRHHRPTIPREVIQGLTPERQRFLKEPYHPQFDRPGSTQFQNLEPLGWKTNGPQRI